MGTVAAFGSSFLELPRYLASSSAYYAQTSKRTPANRCGWPGHTLYRQHAVCRCLTACGVRWEL